MADFARELLAPQDRDPAPGDPGQDP
jgi:hypothetical protein